MENALDSCYQKVAPEGSAFYSSLIKLPEAKKDAVVIVAAFYAEIAECMIGCQEPQMAQIKFQWWRRDVAKLHLGQPEHPTTRLLQQVVKTYSLPPQDFIDIIDQTEVLLHHPTFATLNDVNHHIQQTAGLREYLMARILESEVDKAPASFAELLEYTDQIQRLRQHIQEETLLISDEEMEKFSISLPILHAMRTTPEMVDWLRFRHQMAEKRYREAMSTMTPSKKNQYIHIIIRCELALTLLSAIQSTHYAVLEHWITLTPLRHWWIARRIYLRFKIK